MYKSSEGLKKGLKEVVEISVSPFDSIMHNWRELSDSEKIEFFDYFREALQQEYGVEALELVQVVGTKMFLENRYDDIVIHEKIDDETDKKVMDEVERAGEDCSSEKRMYRRQSKVLARAILRLEGGESNE